MVAESTSSVAVLPISAGRQRRGGPACRRWIRARRSLMLLPRAFLTSHDLEAVVDLHTTAPRSVNSLLPHALLPPLELHVATRSECGPVRTNNEDRFLVVRFDRSTHALATNIDEP